MACDLGDDRSNSRIKDKGAILNKEAANTSKIDRSKKIFDIDIEYKSSLSVNFSVGDDRSALAKPV